MFVHDLHPSALPSRGEFLPIPVSSIIPVVKATLPLAGIARLTCTLTTKWLAVPGALNDYPLFERSASLGNLDFFAYFLCQDKK